MSDCEEDLDDFPSEKLNSPAESMVGSYRAQNQQINGKLQVESQCLLAHTHSLYFNLVTVVNNHLTHALPYIFQECWDPTGQLWYSWIALLQRKQGQIL